MSAKDDLRDLVAKHFEAENARLVEREQAGLAAIDHAGRLLTKATMAHMRGYTHVQESLHREILKLRELASRLHVQAVEDALVFEKLMNIAASYGDPPAAVAANIIKARLENRVGLGASR